MKFGKNRAFNIPFLIMIFFIFNLIGCAALGLDWQVDSDQFDSGKHNPGNLELKKRTLIAPLIDQEGIGKSMKSWITATAVSYTGKNGHLIISKESADASYPKNFNFPHYAAVLDPDMVEKAEKMGMDVLISVILNPFDVTVKKRGIWPFRRYKMDVEISMSMTVLDIVSGTVLLCNEESEGFRKPGSVEEDQELKWKPDSRLFFKFASNILEEQAAEAIDILMHRPWTGKIESVNGNSIVINGGNDIGIAPGCIFEV